MGSRQCLTFSVATIVWLVTAKGAGPYGRGQYIEIVSEFQLLQARR